VPSVNYEKVLSAVNAQYVYGLTATPTRQDGQHPITLMQCGAIRYSVDAKMQAEKRNFEHYVIPCFTGFKHSLTQDEATWHITQIYSALVEDDSRNRQIADDVLDAVNAGRTPIILTQRTEHVSVLAELLKNQCKAHVITLIGADSTKLKHATMETLANVPPDEQLIIIATGKYIGEGFDYPRLDTLFLVSPIAWKGTLAQYAGRLHRDYPGKQDVIVYDYVDIHIPVLEQMYHKRLTGYAQIGYKILAARNQPDKISMIYDTTNFLPVMKNDFACAKKEIIIACPHLRKKRVTTVLEWLQEPLNRGISVTILTSPEEYFSANSISVIPKPDLYQKYVIIDEHLVWYGSIGLLGFWGVEDSIMRLESRELAEELKGGYVKK
jgi:superfamily II DNA or RNA helicase